MLRRSIFLRVPHQQPKPPALRKDFFFKSFDIADQRKRVAVLIDAETMSVETFFKNINPLIRQALNPNVLLYRVFAHSLKPEWQQVIISRQQLQQQQHQYRGGGGGGGGGGDGNNSSSSSVHYEPFESFKVERFIAMHMQVSADAGHIAQLRLRNKVQGVVVCCEHPVAPLYEDQLKKRSIFQLVDRYVVTDTGFTMKEVCG